LLFFPMWQYIFHHTACYLRLNCKKHMSCGYKYLYERNSACGSQNNVWKFPTKLIFCFNQYAKKICTVPLFKFTLILIHLVHKNPIWQREILYVMHDTNWWGTDIFWRFMSYSAIRKLKYDYKYKNESPYFLFNSVPNWLTSYITIQKNKMNIIAAPNVLKHIWHGMTCTSDSPEGFIYFFSLLVHI
jgi:hypothetical protein